MPQAIALAAFNAGAPLAAVNAIAGVGIAGVVLHTAVIVGASVAANQLMRPSTPKPSDGQQEFQQAVPPRMWPYGRVKVSGPIAMKGVSITNQVGDVPNASLSKIVLLAGREIDAFEEHFFDDRLVTLDVNGVVTNTFGSTLEDFVQVKLHLGTDAQTADAMLDAGFTDWTSNHRLRGIAYAAMVFGGADAADFNEIYPNGEPVYSATIRGAKLYDPRLDSTVPGGSGAHLHGTKSTWAWSDNSALCVLDYLTHADGYNRPLAKIDIASFQAMADLCDENVPLAAGGTENRYRTATAVYLTEKRKDVLSRLLEACDATLFTTAAGKIAIRGGEYTAPTVVIDADSGRMLPASFGPIGALDRYNELALQFRSPAHGYSEVEGETWQNAADPDFIAGKIEARPLDLLQVPSHGQARRLAKIRMARDNAEWVGEVVTNLGGLDAMDQEYVTIRWPMLAIDGPFYVESFGVKGDGTGAVLRVRSCDPTAYDWDEDTEEGEPPPVPPDLTET